MTSRRDDDALSWDGDDDPTLDVGGVVDGATADAEADAPRLPDGYTAVGRGSEDVVSATDEEPDHAQVSQQESAPLGNAALIAVGVFGGLYLLYAVGWIVGGLRLAGTAQFLVSPVGYQFALWLAVAAPVLWFGTVLLLTRRSKTWLRIVWLVAGVLLLVPWPFLMVGAVGR